jgi:hypothetical protein
MKLHAILEKSLHLKSFELITMAIPFFGTISSETFLGYVAEDIIIVKSQSQTSSTLHSPGGWGFLKLHSVLNIVVYPKYKTKIK